MGAFDVVHTDTADVFRVGSPGRSDLKSALKSALISTAAIKMKGGPLATRL